MAARKREKHGFLKNALRRMWASQFRDKAIMFWLVTALVGFLALYDCLFAARPVQPIQEWIWVAVFLLLANGFFVVLLYKTGKLPPSVVLIPSSDKLPALWPKPVALHARPNVAILASARSEALMELCDDYWNSFLADFEPDPREDVRVIRESSVHQQALAFLAQRGPETVAWARARLRHPGYDAREDAAWLLGQLAERGHLGAERDAIARELGELATRPWEEDTKEIQANTAALDSLTKIGGPVLLATLRRILTSTEWESDEIQWNAARILSKTINEPFVDGESPVKAAKAWIAANPSPSSEH